MPFFIRARLKKCVAAFDASVMFGVGPILIFQISDGLLVSPSLTGTYGISIDRPGRSVTRGSSDGIIAIKRHSCSSLNAWFFKVGANDTKL